MDDDNYVNARALLKLLKAFPQTLDVYIGRPSLNRPIHAVEPQPHNRTVGRSVGPSLASSGPGHQPGASLDCGVWGGARPGAGLWTRRWAFWVSLCVKLVALPLTLCGMGRLRSCQEGRETRPGLGHGGAVAGPGHTASAGMSWAPSHLCVVWLYRLFKCEYCRAGWLTAQASTPEHSPPLGDPLPSDFTNLRLES